MNDHINYDKLFGTRWRAYYKNGLMNPTIVYGESEKEAKNAALAEYRRNTTLLDMWPVEKIVDRVELLAD